MKYAWYPGLAHLSKRAVVPLFSNFRAIAFIQLFDAVCKATPIYLFFDLQMYVDSFYYYLLIFTNFLCLIVRLIKLLFCVQFVSAFISGSEKKCVKKRFLNG